MAWTLPSADDSTAALAAAAAADAEAAVEAKAERARLALARAAPGERDRSASALHNKKVINALLRYMYSTDAPFKHRVVALLTQLLTAPHLFVGSLPSHRPLVVLRKVVAFRLQAEADGGGVFVPLRLQHVAELAAVAENFARFHMLEGSRPLFRATVQQRAATARRSAKKVKLVPPLALVVLPPNPTRHVALRLAIVLAECLQTQLRVPDSIACEAWLDSLGTRPSEYNSKLQSKIWKAKPLIAEALVSDAAVSLRSPDVNAELVEWVYLTYRYILCESC